jgi:hypothetical protein
MDQPEDDAAILTIENADGSLYSIQLLAAFDFEGQEYGVFKPIEVLIDDEESAEGGGLTILQIVRKGDGEASVREIADNKEYDRVVAYVEELMRKNGG